MKLLNGAEPSFFDLILYMGPLCSTQPFKGCSAAWKIEGSREGFHPQELCRIRATFLKERSVNSHDSVESIRGRHGECKFEAKKISISNGVLLLVDLFDELKRRWRRSCWERRTELYLGAIFQQNLSSRQEVISDIEGT